MNEKELDKDTNILSTRMSEMSKGDKIFWIWIASFLLMLVSLFLTLSLKEYLIKYLFATICIISFIIWVYCFAGGGE